MAWIQLSTKPFPSFNQANRERVALLPRLAADHRGPDNVKVRIRRRNAGRFDVVSWRREPSVDLTPTKSEPAVKRTTRVKSNLLAVAAAMSLLTGGR
jgi:hypothetical protein